MQLFPCILQVFRECLKTKADTIPKTRLRILSVDGGGVKGIMPAFILDQLEKELQEEVTRWQQAEEDPVSKQEDPAVESLRPILKAIKAKAKVGHNVVQGMVYFGPVYPILPSMPSLPRRPTLGLVVSGASHSKGHHQPCTFQILECCPVSCSSTERLSASIALGKNSRLSYAGGNPKKLRIVDFFDVIGGTSTGGLIAAFLATKEPTAGDRVGQRQGPIRPAEELVSMYQELSRKVFPHRRYTLRNFLWRIGMALCCRCVLLLAIQLGVYSRMLHIVQDI